MALTRLAQETVSGSDAASLSTGTVTTVADRLYMLEFRGTMSAGATLKVTVNGNTTDTDYTRSTTGSTGATDQNSRPQYALDSGATFVMTAYFIVVNSKVIYLIQSQETDNAARLFYNCGEVDEASLSSVSIEATSGTPIAVDSQISFYDLGGLTEVANEEVSGADVSYVGTGTLTTETDKTYLALSIIKTSGDCVLDGVINNVTTLTDYRYGYTSGFPAEGTGLSIRSTQILSSDMDLLVSVSLIRVFDSRPFFTTVGYRRRTSGSRALVSANLHTTETNFDEFGWDCTTTQIEDGSKIQLLEWI